MRIVIFCHSLVSDWNHGNAHFLRGVATELLRRGHQVMCCEPEDAWSLRNLIAAHGDAPVAAFRAAYPQLSPHRYTAGSDPAPLVEDADLVLVHEWNDSALVARLGELRRSAGFRLLFHDTHHRAVTRPEEMARYDLRAYDGVLAFGEVIRQLYLDRGWAEHVWTWHEAADTRVFRPLPGEPKVGDVAWIGNWGDDERSRELREFLIEPVRSLRLSTTVHGVRYPDSARAELQEAGVHFAGWVPNFEAPRVYARHRVTVHVPRQPYVRQLPGIPTIRPFEALACGVPLISAPWDDVESLFQPGADFLVARDGAEMRRHLQTLLAEPELAQSLAAHGRRTVLERHTCAHRVDELMRICERLGIPVPDGAAPAATGSLESMTA
jgi:spore maturation protein CgeB